MDSFGQINRSISVLLFFVVSSASCFRIGSLGKTRLPLSMTTVQGAAPAIKLSPMVENMAVSKTIEIHALTKEMEKNGQTVFSLCVGEPDYEPPAEVVAATHTAATSGFTKYTSVNGDAALRSEIAKDLSSRKGTKYSADQIVVSNGAKQSVLQSLMAVVSPGDKVLVPAPYWTSYPDMVKICGGVPTIVQTRPEEGYVLRPAALREALTKHPEVTCLILCNPSNPTGGVADKDSLVQVAQVLADFPKVVVISDEIYERLTYDVPHTSFASLPGMFDRTVTVNGFSKSHSMTGYRLGYSASSTQLAKANSKIQSQMTSCASSISQYAATVALRDVPESWMRDRVQELRQKRDFAYDLLMKIPHLSCPKPDGAFYLLPDISHYYNRHTKRGNKVTNSHELCLELLRDEGVALVSGDAFGAEKCLRISYAASFTTIENSITRLSSFLASLK